MREIESEHPVVWVRDRVREREASRESKGNDNTLFIVFGRLYVNNNNNYHERDEERLTKHGEGMLIENREIDRGGRGLGWWFAPTSPFRGPD